MQDGQQGARHEHERSRAIIVRKLVKIQHPKIASMDPSWAPFAGWSMIFSPIGGDGNTKLLLARIAKGFSESLRDIYAKNFSLCPLPPSTYHVTFCDLINQGNAMDVFPDVRADWQRGLEDAALRPPPHLWSILDRAGLASGSLQSKVGFEFESITTGNGKYLAVKLRPVRINDFAKLINIRDQLNALLPKRPVRGHYTPHITLGYFADPQLGKLAVVEEPSINEIVESAFQRQTLHFSTIELYAFSDMVSYRRCESEAQQTLPGPS